MDKLNTFLKMFYAPLAGMRDARERLSIFAASIIALIAASIYELFTQAPHVAGLLRFTFPQTGFDTLSVALGATHKLLFVGLIFVPVLIFAANLFERRGSLRVVVMQEYASLASAILMAWAAASVVALPVLALLRASGVEQAVVAENMAQLALWRDQMPDIENYATPQYVAQQFATQLRLIFFAIWAAFATREVFRLPVLKTITVVALGGVLMFPLTAILYPVFRLVIGSPLLLIFLFIFLRGYFTELTRTQRARADFRQNLEAATLNPADASAHYNLGLIHLDRKELTEARERFARAVEIDPRKPTRITASVTSAVSKANTRKR
jgi:tetratricopeptide (TPR) repeat protein